MKNSTDKNLFLNRGYITQQAFLKLMPVIYKTATKNNLQNFYRNTARLILYS